MVSKGQFVGSTGTASHGYTAKKCCFISDKLTYLEVGWLHLECFNVTVITLLCSRVMRFQSEPTN